MKVDEFIALVKRNGGKEIKFEYVEGQYVKAGYHLTEVKNVSFDSTDCGGRTDSWSETHMQLWEDPSAMGIEHPFGIDGQVLSVLESRAAVMNLSDMIN